MLLDDKDMSELTIHTHTTHTHFKTIIKESPHLTSRRLKQSKIKFFIVSPNLLATTISNTYKTQIKMSIYNIAKLSNKDLKKLASEYISLDDVYDECQN